MKNVIKFALLAAVFSFFTTDANASLLSSLLTGNARTAVDEINDSSAGWFIDGNDGTTKLTSGLLDVNDIIQGVIRVDAVNNGDGGAALPVGGKEIYAVYSFKIASVVDNGSGGWSSVKLEAAGDLMTAIAGSTNLRSRTGLNGLASSGVGVAILEKAGAAGLAPTDITSISYFNDSAWELTQTYGFDTTDARDDYVITGRSIFLPDSTQVNVNLRDLDQLDSLNNTFGPGQTIADFDATFILEGSESIESQTLFNSALGNNGNLIITNGTISTTTKVAAGQTQQFMFQDSGTFNGKFHGVPEPSTIAIWAALGLGGCGFVARRRTKAKKA